MGRVLHNAFIEGLADANIYAGKGNDVFEEYILPFQDPIAMLPRLKSRGSSLHLPQLLQHFSLRLLIPAKSGNPFVAQSGHQDSLAVAQLLCTPSAGLLHPEMLGLYLSFLRDGSSSSVFVHLQHFGAFHYAKGEKKRQRRR